jgi:hypothetical protein
MYFKHIYEVRFLFIISLKCNTAFSYQFICLNHCRSRWPRGLRRRSWPLGYWDREFEYRLTHGCLCFCVALSGVGSPLGWADHPTKGVMPSVLIRLRNLRCKAAKVLRRTVETQNKVSQILYARSINIHTTQFFLRRINEEIRSNHFMD